MCVCVCVQLGDESSNYLKGSNPRFCLIFPLSLNSPTFLPLSIQYYCT